VMRTPRSRLEHRATSGVLSRFTSDRGEPGRLIRRCRGRCRDR
jgi:hypothetical protein